MFGFAAAEKNAGGAGKHILWILVRHRVVRFLGAEEDQGHFVFLILKHEVFQVPFDLSRKQAGGRARQRRRGRGDGGVVGRSVRTGRENWSWETARERN